MLKNNIDKIILGCKNGEEKSQLYLYDRFSEAMFNIVCRYVPNEEDAKDVMQEGFIKAFTRINDYKPNYTIGSWLKRIIIHHSIDFLKKRKLNLVSLDNNTLQIAKESDEIWEFDNSISKKEIIKAIDHLKPKYKIIAQLYLIEGYDHEEIAQIMTIPVKTSRTQLRRAKLALQSALKTKYHAVK